MLRCVRLPGSGGMGWAGKRRLVSGLKMQEAFFPRNPVAALAVALGGRQRRVQLA
jgi:hypothetical protein